MDIDYKTQYLQVLRHLQRYGSITSMEAITKWKITRLSACIFTLREDGYTINSTWESNETKHWVKYIFDKEVGNFDRERTTKTHNSPKEMRKEVAIEKLRILWGLDNPTDDNFKEVANAIETI